VRVLITNNTLDWRAGSELYVRDVAVGLLRRGHQPVAFSTRLGAVADELRAATIPVVDDPARLAEPPDLIHGHHHLETTTAMLHFPGVPVVSFCHGWLPWEECPPVSPRIRRYVAVDEVCRERLVAEHGIASDRVEVLLNFVDLARFRPRGPLPPRPRRALVISNGAGDASQLPAVRAACSKLGIELEVAGALSGRVLDRPEEVLPEFDLVFAKGRAALEALAVGAAVVVCDARGLGPMVTTDALARLRALNFGVRLLSRPLEPSAVVEEVGRYDPEDAAAVCARVRDQAGLEKALDRIEAIYRRALETPPFGDASPVAESRSASRYLLFLSPTLKNAWGVAQERDRLAAALEVCRADGDRQREEAEELGSEISRMRATITWRSRDFLLRSILVRALRRVARRLL
jgi:hypothetical protein